MAKLKDTVNNRLIVSGVTIGGMALLGYLYALYAKEKEHRQFFIVGGAFLGVFILMGVFAAVIEETVIEVE